ncbi:hypothetical protein [Hyphomicrobium sp. ghe19]|uniref:hypothetical protein n=1 Tax=Hyphomicrobium sp. ghe19 TaxID=2682968 RepID=UPI0030D20BC8
MVRNPIESRLSEIKSELPKLRNLARSQKALDDIKTELNVITETIWLKVQSLSEILDETDKADWVIEKGWLASVQVRFDTFLECTARASEPVTSHAILGNEVNEAANSLSEAAKELKERIRRELSGHIRRQ